MVRVAVSVVTAHRPPADDRMAKFVSTVLADTEDVWTDVFKKGGAEYQKPKLVLFRGATSTACGQGQSAMGPFATRPTKRSTSTWAFTKPCMSSWVRR